MSLNTVVTKQLQELVKLEESVACISKVQKNIKEDFELARDNYRQGMLKLIPGLENWDNSSLSELDMAIVLECYAKFVLQNLRYAIEDDQSQTKMTALWSKYVVWLTPGFKTDTAIVQQVHIFYFSIFTCFFS